MAPNRVDSVEISNAPADFFYFVNQCDHSMMIKKFLLKTLKYSVIIPQDEASYQDILDGTVAHIKTFFAENSTLMTSIEMGGEKVSKMIFNSLQNTSLINTWNKTLQEYVN